MAEERQFAGCEVVKKLHSGPATEWFLARQVSLKRNVLVKALSLNVLPESAFAVPLKREAQLLGQLRHEHVVQLYDFVERHQTMWQVLEHVDGWRLEEVLQERKTLSAASALSIALLLCRTLSYVHEQGIVHRDIQPKNILISRRAEIKLSNFFLALEHRGTPPPELIDGEAGFMSPAYMSPEQVLGETADPRSDLFSLGVMLYEMIAGKRPFDADDDHSTAQRIRHEPPPPLSKYVANIAAPVERIVQRALQKFPGDRFSDALEMEVAIRSALNALHVASPEQALQDMLAKAGLIVKQTSKKRPPVAPHTTAKRGRSQHSVFLGYLGFSAALLVGFSGIELAFGNRTTQPQQAVEQTLELAPENPAYLRVVVKPWAHVFIDGQQVDTTPVGRALPLRPGTHHVRFEHPDARTNEEREIEAHAGQSIFLDVVMKLPNLGLEETQAATGPQDAGWSP